MESKRKYSEIKFSWVEKVFYLKKQACPCMSIFVCTWNKLEKFCIFALIEIIFLN